MPAGPFPHDGQDGEEPENSRPSPADRNGPQPGSRDPADDQDSGEGPPAADTGESEDPGAPDGPPQGLFLCLPAGPADLSGFADGTATAPIAPGPLLAGVACAVAGSDGGGLAQVSEDCLFSVLAAGRRMSSWGTWLELAAMQQLALRHPATQDRTSRQKRAAGIPETPANDQPAASRPTAGRRTCGRSVRSPGTPGWSPRELPSDEVLASWQHVEQRALDLRAAGVPGSLRELRIKAYLDLLQERDSRLVAGTVPDQGQEPGEGPDGNGGPQDGPGGNGGSGPRPHSPAGTSPDGRVRPAGPSTGPCLAALVNITVPLATALGQSGTPGEAAGFGLLDAGTARDLIAAAGRSPHTRWCVTVLHPDGTAAAHGCAAGRHPPPPGPEPPGPEPGVLKWRTPHGRTFTTIPTVHPV